MATSVTADRVRDRRWALGYSVRQIEAPGLSAGYVSLIENGYREPSLKALRLLAVGLGVSAHYLETGEPDPALVLAEYAESLENALTRAGGYTPS